MQLAPHLRRVGSDVVAMYLVDDDTGVTLVDAGIPGQWRELEAELAAMGRTPADIRGVVLTHGDSDHVGVAERLRREFGVQVFVHEADRARALGEPKKLAGGWGRFRVGPMLRFLWYAGRRGGLRVRPLSEVRTFRGGDVLDLPGSPRIVHLPGHTARSVAVQVPQVDAVFVGDALTTGHVLTGETGPRPAPFTVDPAQALRSLDALDGVEATWVLPGHGAPWRGGLADALARVRAAA